MFIFFFSLEKKKIHERYLKIQIKWKETETSRTACSHVRRTGDSLGKEYWTVRTRVKGYDSHTVLFNVIWFSRVLKFFLILSIETGSSSRETRERGGGEVH